MHSNHIRGLLGVLGIWVTAGIALPFINLLDDFSPAQLMVFRGFITAGIAFCLSKGVIGKVDVYTKLMAIVLPLATLGLFEGIRNLGAGPTIIIITATPVVNFIFGWLTGRTPTAKSILIFGLILFGVTMAQWGGSLNLQGISWAIFGTIMNGILYELFVKSESSSMQKCFYTCSGMGMLGAVLSIGTPWPNLQAEPLLITMVLLFAFVGGFLYWISNMWAFDNLPTNEASVLAQGETPAVIIGAYIILGERLTVFQCLGVIIALSAAYSLLKFLKSK